MMSLGSLGRARRAIPIAAAATLAGCAGATGDVHAINGSLLRALTADGRAICVDARAYGEPLAVFRTMSLAPSPARRPLAWHAPTPLDAGQSLKAGKLADAELRGERIVLPERSQGRDTLSMVEQIQLNGVAREAAVSDPESRIWLRPDPQAPKAKVRWWLLNRLDGGCGPSYTVSRPVILRDSAFVTVTAGHRGTTYAFRKAQGRWSPAGKWSTWLY